MVVGSLWINMSIRVFMDAYERFCISMESTGLWGKCGGLLWIKYVGVFGRLGT